MRAAASPPVPARHRLREQCDGRDEEGEPADEPGGDARRAPPRGPTRRAGRRSCAPRVRRWRTSTGRCRAAPIRPGRRRTGLRPRASAAPETLRRTSAAAFYPERWIEVPGGLDPAGHVREASDRSRGPVRRARRRGRSARRWRRRRRASRRRSSSGGGHSCARGRGAGRRSRRRAARGSRRTARRARSRPPSRAAPSVSAASTARASSRAARRRPRRARPRGGRTRRRGTARRSPSRCCISTASARGRWRRELVRLRLGEPLAQRRAASRCVIRLRLGARQAAAHARRGSTNACVAGRPRRAPRPPCRLARHRHQRRDQQGPDEQRVEQHADRHQQRELAERPQRNDREQGERAGERDARDRDGARGRGRRHRDRLAHAPAPRLLADARRDEHVVVRPERDEQHHRHERDVVDEVAAPTSASARAR